MAEVKCPVCGGNTKKDKAGYRCTREFRCGWQQHEHWFDQQYFEMTGEEWDSTNVRRNEGPRK